MEGTEGKIAKKLGRYVRNFDAASAMTKIVIKNTGEKFTLFFSIRSPFSNFYPCKIRIKEESLSGYQEVKVFTCTEQYYMYHKALTCGDYETALAIMGEREANRIKKLGRYVRNFDALRWEKICMDVMRRGNMEKYIQNSELRHSLFCTLGTRMVECSPTDTIWGIGLDIEDSNASNPITWRGENRLGQVLTGIRDELCKRKEYAKEVERALQFVKGFDRDAENFFNGSSEKTHSHIPSTVSFFLPSVFDEMSSELQYMNTLLPPVSSASHDTNFAENSDSLGFLRQRRKRKSDEGVRNSLQRLNNPLFDEYEGLSSSVKHMKYKDDEEMSPLEDKSSKTDSLVKLDGPLPNGNDSTSHRHQKEEVTSVSKLNNHSSSSRRLSSKSPSSSTCSDSPEKQSTETIAEKLDMVIGNGNYGEFKSQSELNLQMNNSKVFEDDTLESLNLSMSDERYKSFLARLQSKPCERWKDNEDVMSTT